MLCFLSFIMNENFGFVNFIYSHQLFKRRRRRFPQQHRSLCGFCGCRLVWFAVADFFFWKLVKMSGAIKNWIRAGVPCDKAECTWPRALVSVNDSNANDVSSHHIAVSSDFSRETTNRRRGKADVSGTSFHLLAHTQS